MTNSETPDAALDIDNPELTDRDIERMRPAREVLSPAAYARLTDASEVGLQLPAETIKAFALDGDDWRERMADVLVKAAKAKRAA